MADERAGSAPLTRHPRVLFVTHNAPRFEGDAAGSFVLRLAVALQAHGAEVEVLAPGAAGLAETSRLEGVVIRRVRYASDRDMTLAYTGKMAEAVRGAWRARLAFIGLLRAFRTAVRGQLDAAVRAGAPYDVVHVHWWFPSGLALWRALRSSDPPMIITMHGSDIRLAASMPIAHGVMRAVLGRAARCTAVSTWLADSSRRIAPAVPVEVAPMPVDVRHFTLPTHATPRRDLLFVGRLNAQKGLADLLDAMETAALQDISLDIVGDGTDGAKLRGQADALGITSRLRWHGALSQPMLVPLYQRAAAVAMPSRGEGLGLVAVEAQLCGAPVVAYADGGLVDVVRQEHGGTLVPVGDVGALALALGTLSANVELAAKQGALAREAILTRFAPDVVAARYLALYADLGAPQ